MLSELGYEVVEAASAEEALSLLDRIPHIDGIITDHLMPGMTGVDLARAIRVKRPGTPVLLLSGLGGGDERQQPENEQVIILGPTNHGQAGRRYEHCHQAPVVDRAERRMTAAALGTQHRDGAGNHADKSQHDVQADHGQEDRRRGRYRDSRDDSRFLGCHGLATPAWTKGRGAATAPSVIAAAIEARKVTQPTCVGHAAKARRGRRRCTGTASQLETAGRRTAKLATPHARHSTPLPAKAAK